VSEVEIRLSGKPADVDNAVAELRAAHGTRLKLRGRQESRSGPGKVIQYGRFAAAVQPVPPASGSGAAR
jgi:hypothetical protein